MNSRLLIDGLTEWFSNENKGVFVTLNGITKDVIQFESDLIKFSKHLNEFSYGRSFIKGSKRLMIGGGIEIGQLNQMLHAHLIIKWDEDMKRSGNEMQRHIRKYWYGILNQSNIYGNMVNINDINVIETRISYALKDTQYWLRNNTSNLVIL